MFADFENLLFCLTATVLHPFFSTFQWEMIHRSWNEITDMEAMKNDIVETIERGFTIQISEPPFLHCNTRRGKTWTLMDRNTRMKKVFKGFFSYMLPYKGFICLKMIGQFMNVRRCINFIIIKSNKIVASLTFFS